MIDLFSSLPLRADGVTGNYVQAQVRIHARDLFTGVFHLDGNERLMLFFLRGRLVSTYRLEGSCWRVLPVHVRDDVISSATGGLRILGVPEEGLRVLRLLLEAGDGEPGINSSLRGSELFPYLSRWQRGNRAGLVHLREGDSNAVMVLPAGSMDLTEGVLVSGSGSQIGPVVLTQVRHWENRSLQITLHADSDHSEAWREYYLRISFAQFVKGILGQYERLAGRFLIADLDEQVNNECRLHGWSISLFGNILANREYFETTDRAGRAYASLLEAIDHQMESVIGRSVARNILLEVASQLTGEKRRLMEEQVLSRFSFDTGARVEEVAI